MNMNNLFIFQNSTKLISGTDALEHLAHELALLGASRPMVLSDPSLVRIGHVKKVTNALSNGGVTPTAVFTELPADAPIEQVNAAASHFRDHGCDSVIAVGGGSVLDAAKGVSMAVSTGVLSVKDVMGYDRLTGTMIPFIAVPTTAGTGSESTLVAVLSDHDAEVKREYVSYLLQPHTAILDPMMTISLPPRVTAATGMDALVHAIEAYSGRQKNPLSRAYARSAVTLISSYMLRAVTNGTDAEARIAMANAAYMAGAAFSNSMVGGVHAIGHAIGAVCGLPHGEIMSILLPHVLRFNMSDPAASADYADLAAVFDSQKPVASDLVEAITDIQDHVAHASDLPTRLRDLDVRKDQFPAIVDKAWLDGAIINNPVELTKKDCGDLLNAAW